MIVGILGLSMLAGLAAAGAALVSGYSVLAALAIYSGAGAVCVLGTAAVIMACSALRLRVLSLGATGFPV